MCRVPTADTIQCIAYISITHTIFKTHAVRINTVVHRKCKDYQGIILVKSIGTSLGGETSNFLKHTGMQICCEKYEFHTRVQLSRTQHLKTA